MTTAIVTVFLIVNIIGRLSGAAFGLAFNLMDTKTNLHPARVSNWSTPFSRRMGGDDSISRGWIDYRQQFNGADCTSLMDDNCEC